MLLGLAVVGLTLGTWLGISDGKSVGLVDGAGLLVGKADGMPLGLGDGAGDSVGESVGAADGSLVVGAGVG